MVKQNTKTEWAAHGREIAQWSFCETVLVKYFFPNSKVISIYFPLHIIS